jgi:ATP-dependent DNA helicase RecQ
MDSRMAEARAVLLRYFGYADFRPGQVDVVASVLSGADTLGVLPTGGGKSLCYQVPALVMPRLTIVISPLISLMKDQVQRLEGRGIAATFLNGTLDSAEVSRRLSRVARGEMKMLYLSPERFAAPDLRAAIQGRGISLIAVDEAHCISEWGHEFRPAFRKIADVSATYGRPQIVAVTATATPRVRADIARQLVLRSPTIIVGGFDRGNLHYAVRWCPNDAARMRALVRLLTSRLRSCVVYAATRNSVMRVTRQLRAARLKVAAYHGGMDEASRSGAQDRFMSGRLDAIVATNAFGMGIDKPDVRLVVHYEMPGTLEAYYQEAGRAGRDGQAARCVLLHSDADRQTHEFFMQRTRRWAIEKAKLEAMERYARLASCRRAFALRYFGESGCPDRCSACDNCDLLWPFRMARNAHSALVRLATRASGATRR